MEDNFSSCSKVLDDDFRRSRVSLTFRKVFLVAVFASSIFVAPIYESHTVSCCILILERIISMSGNLFFLRFHSSVDNGACLWSIQILMIV